MIKYLGSKRTLVPALAQIADLSGARTALDAFTGTTRVAQAFKALGITTAANDVASYSRVLSDCYIATDKRQINDHELRTLLCDLEATPGEPGYFTETFCEKSRFFQPKNGARIDAIRNRIETEFAADPRYPILLTSLMEAADRVDSTTGLQMAYLKKWAPRAYNDLELRVPELLDGTGTTYQRDTNALIADPTTPRFDLVYLDPPYNQHRYFTNYHIWETLIRWDCPEAYGVAQKRVDARDSATHSAYNRKREMPQALQSLIAQVDTDTLVLSYNNESWIDFDTLFDAVAAGFEDCVALAFDYKRYVGAQIGIYNPEGTKVGKVTHLRNLEYLFVGCSAQVGARIRAAFHVPDAPEAPSEPRLLAQVG